MNTQSWKHNFEGEKELWYNIAKVSISDTEGLGAFTYTYKGFAFRDKILIVILTQLDSGRKISLKVSFVDKFVFQKILLEI